MNAEGNALIQVGACRDVVLACVFLQDLDSGYKTTLPTNEPHGFHGIPSEVDMCVVTTQDSGGVVARNLIPALIGKLTFANSVFGPLFLSSPFHPSFVPHFPEGFQGGEAEDASFQRRFS